MTWMSAFQDGKSDVELCVCKLRAYQLKCNMIVRVDNRSPERITESRRR